MYDEDRGGSVGRKPGDQLKEGGNAPRRKTYDHDIVC
jgi:hypothetical protein